MRTRLLLVLTIAAAMLASMLGLSPAAAAQSAPPDAVLDETVLEDLGIDTAWRDLMLGAINPDDFECQQDTPLRLVIGESINSINPAALDALFSVGADIWPTIYSLFFDNDDSDEFFGVDGEYTREMIKRHKDNKRFWDVPNDDILLQAMHGSVIADDAKMLQVIPLLFGPVPPEVAQEIVDFAQFVIDVDPSVDYDHPLFTLNAFAFSGEGEEIIPGLGITPDKIVMGDGILEVLALTGLEDTGLDTVHAHEFGHHVQFELGAFEDGPQTPEGTRRTELMADAFAGYNLAHARGATFQAKRIAGVYEASFGIGDCAFDDPGHHGTPNQRLAASQWGAALAKQKPRGRILSPQTMLDMFDAVLPELIAPDAP